MFKGDRCCQHSMRQLLGLGSTQPRKYHTASEIERMEMIFQEVHNREEVTRISIAVEFGVQRSLTTWTVLERIQTWADICRHETLRLLFLLKSFDDVFPFNANLYKYGLLENQYINSANKNETLHHVSLCYTCR